MGAKGRVAALLRGEVDVPDALLGEKVASWRAAGVRTAGVLAEPRGEARGASMNCSAGYLRDIGTDAPQRIYLEYIPAGADCDLDAAAVASACQQLIDQIAESDVVVLSKFGKLEASGGGLVPAFRAAIAAGKPVLTSVSERHLDAWKDFAPEAVLLSSKAELDSWERAPRG